MPSSARSRRPRRDLRRVGETLGVFVAEPRLMPNGSSLHYMGTMRMGDADDGTSVADPYSRVWGVDGLVVGGNALIPTANTMNPTLTSVAIAVRGARKAIEELSRVAEPPPPRRASDAEKVRSVPRRCASAPRSVPHLLRRNRPLARNRPSRVISPARCGRTCTSRPPTTSSRRPPGSPRR